MILNPIIPIWIMVLICIVLIAFVIYDKQFFEKIKINNKDKTRTPRQKQLIKNYVINLSLKVLIIIIIFIINMRPMVQSGEAEVLTTDASVLFVIDKSVSMAALDYNGEKERLEGIRKDCTYIIDELAGAKFSVITFGDEAKKELPFTIDSNMVNNLIKSIRVEDEYYAKGTSINIVNDVLEKTLKEQKEQNAKEGKSTQIILFFITDGEITSQDKTLESFENIRQYISDGAVLGYGTTTGGKMVRELYKDQPNSEYYYKYYYDENYKRQVALSKIDESNLNKLATDMSIEYIHMDRQSNINNKLRSIKQKLESSESNQDKTFKYDDIYYYFAAILGILLILNFVNQKRRIQ